MARAKGKQWYSLIAPRMFGEKELGHTLAHEPNLTIGRRVSVSAIDLLGDYRKYYLKFYFRIKEVKNGKALAEFDGLECLRDYIARMVVRRVRRIDLVADIETKDKKLVRVKVIVVIRRGASRSVQRRIRKELGRMVREKVSGMGFEDFIKAIISEELKNRMVQKLSKIYPIRHLEFRKIEVKS